MTNKKWEGGQPTQPGPFASFDEFADWWEKNMTASETLQVGRASSGNSRTFYPVGKAMVYEETSMPSDWTKPTTVWYWTGHHLSPQQAKSFAGQYNADVIDAFYTDNDEKMLAFNNLRDCLRWLWDNEPAAKEPGGAQSAAAAKGQPENPTPEAGDIRQAKSFVAAQTSPPARRRVPACSFVWGAGCEPAWQGLGLRSSI